jgi:hypothetical protein
MQFPTDDNTTLSSSKMVASVHTHILLPSTPSSYLHLDRYSQLLGCLVWCLVQHHDQEEPYLGDHDWGEDVAKHSNQPQILHIVTHSSHSHDISQWNTKLLMDDG